MPPRAQSLLDAARQHPRLKVMEAFNGYKHHPQWQLARKLVKDGQILGELRTIRPAFPTATWTPTTSATSPTWAAAG